MRPHWSNCLTHFDTEVETFAGKYFARSDRRCLLVAGAGFDPRARRVARILSGAMNGRLSCVLIREERGDPAANLQADADANEAELKAMIPDAAIMRISIFAEDGAPVGGNNLATELRKFAWPDGLTDVVLDMSALSIGVGFPAAKLLLEHCERRVDLNFHLMVASNPELDASIIGEPADRMINARGFAGDPDVVGGERIARIWLPQLAHRRGATLTKIRAANEDIYKVCPILPFPARDPRRADELITEFGPQLRDEWQVDARDLIYVSERNPLDCYRTITMLKQRYDRTVEGVYVPQLILSPIGSKVMAAGALMAAIEHDLTVQYVETLRYDFKVHDLQPRPATDMIVHVWLHGPIYAGYAGHGAQVANPPKLPVERLP